MELVKQRNPRILILLENRVASHQAQWILRRTKLKNMLGVEAMGFAGEIWVLWDKDWISIGLIGQQEQLMAVAVQEGIWRPWILSIVYASPKPVLWGTLWQYITHLGEYIHLSWRLLETLIKFYVKLGGCIVSLRQVGLLWDMITLCHLMELDHHGLRFVWSNMRVGSQNIQQQLDQGLCNID